jgi:hypothetical protein
MTTLQIKITNAETGEDIQRDMTAEEIAEYKAAAADYKKSQLAAKAEAEAKETAKQAILDRIGLTADELKTILG